MYYCVGADFLRGTWVQTAWAVLAVVTLLMGSSLAFKEKVLKKRLAYSTVSKAKSCHGYGTAAAIAYLYKQYRPKSAI